MATTSSTSSSTPTTTSLSGGSGSDTLNGTSGNDLFVYNVSQNSAGTSDVYTGGAAIDTVLIEFTLQQWLNPSYQSQVAAYLAHLQSWTNMNTGTVSNGYASDFTFTFGTSKLKVQMMEKLMVTVDGAYQDPADMACLAVDDTASATEDSNAITINVLANDSVPDLVKSVALGSAPGHGTATMIKPDAANASTWYFAYQVNKAEHQSLAVGQSRTDSFTYVVTDADGDASTATVSITITGTNDGPVAVADTGAITENQSVTVDVLANDTDVDDGHVFTLVNAAAPAGKGTASIVANQLAFTPGSDFDHLAQGATEVVTVSYEMRDEHGALSSSTATITITATNDGPVAVADTGAMTENQTVTLDVLANDTDVDDGHVFTLVNAGGPAGKGSVSIAANQLVFTPGTDFDHLSQRDSEVVTVSYEMSDEHGALSSSRATIIVIGTNDGPVAVADTGAITENQALTLDVLANDTDVDDGHVFTLMNAAVQGTGSASVVGNQLVFEPGTAFDHLAQGATELVTVNYAMHDEQGAVSNSTVTITVTGVNDPAVTTGSPQAMVLEAGAINGGTIYALGYVDSTDVDSDPSVRMVPADTLTEYGKYSLEQPSAESVSWRYFVNNADSRVQALNDGQTLTDTFTLFTQDGTPHSVTVTIVGANDAAVITGAASGTVLESGGSTNDDNPADVSGTLFCADVDNEANVFRAASGRSGYGSYEMTSEGHWTYHLDNTNGNVQALNVGDTLVDKLTFHSQDGTATEVSVTISGANDPASIGGSFFLDLVEAGGKANGNAGKSRAFGDLYCLDVDNATDVFQPVVLTSGQYGTYSMDAAGVWSYNLDNTNTDVQALNVGDTIYEVLTFHSQDGTPQDWLRVTVRGANDAAVITGNGGGSVTEAGSGKAGNPSATGTLVSSDVDNTNLFQGVASAAAMHGTYTMTTAGQWTYTLNNADPAIDALNTGSTLADSFVVKTADGTLTTVNISIAGTTDIVNHAPTDLVLTPYGGSGELLGALTTIDPDAGDSHTYELVDAAGHFYISDDTVNITGGLQQSEYYSFSIRSTDTAGETVTRNFDVFTYTDENDIVSPLHSFTTSAYVMYGGASDDTFRSNHPNNWFFGGSGADEMFGGSGLDKFVLDGGGFANSDHIFNFAADDKIVLNHSGTANFDGLETGALSAAAFSTSTDALTSDHRIIYSSSGLGGTLYYDADGTGPEEKVEIAFVGMDALNPYSLSYTDFIVI